MSPFREYKPKPPEPTYELPPPSSFGDLFPPKFTEWRNDQPKAILTTIDGDRRFVGQAAPTGFGKSPSYLGAALLSGKRTAILTSTKGLQEQLIADFNGDGKQRLVDVRGQNAYRCIAAVDFDYPEYTTVDRAPCHTGRQCTKKSGGCKYYDAVRAAKEAQIVVTNYAFWLSINRYGEGLGNFELLILDEAHDVPDILADFMSIEISPEEMVPVAGKLMDPGADIRQWAEWAGYWHTRVEQRLEQLTHIIRTSPIMPQGAIRESGTLKKLLGKLESLTEAGDDWVIEKVEDKRNHTWKMRFDPLWPYQHAEKLLFAGIPRVVLMSATLRDKTAKLLGIDDADWDFHEYGSNFAKERRPIIHVPTVQMKFSTSESDLGLWCQRIDQIIRGRQDRKGIIHTVSFARAKMVLENSDFRSLMLLNDSKNTKWTVERFKTSTEPCVLVSPSVTTGYDFPYTECEYQIIGKLPFPDNRAKIIKARMEHDKEFSEYITMQVLIQMCGRGMRAMDDSCETIIVDDSITWFMGRNGKKFAPRWFTEALVWATSLPRPLPKL